MQFTDYAMEAERYHKIVAKEKFENCQIKFQNLSS